MNRRQLQMLRLLTSSIKPIHAEMLSERFDVGLRTIQNDIAVINQMLFMEGFPQIEKQHGKGFVLLLTEAQRIRLEQLLYDLHGSHVILSPEERMLFILKMLLLKYKQISLGEIGLQLDVSRGTAVNDVAKLRKRLENENIQLIFDAQQGYVLSGEEGKIREFMVYAYLEQMDLKNILSAEQYHKSSLPNLFYVLRNFEDSELIYKLIERLNIELNRKMTGKAFLKLLTHVELAIERNRLGHTIALNSFYMESLYGIKEFSKLCKALRQIGDHFDVSLSLEEAGYLTLQMLGDRAVTGGDTGEENYADIQLMVFGLISRVGRELGVDFSRDEALYHDLVRHIRPAIFRVKHNICQSNPLKDEILSHYGQICNAVETHLQPIQEQIGKTFSKDEICFLALHFASVLERQAKSEAINPRVLLVCESGIGTSNLLAARLSALYEINIVDTVAYYECERAHEQYQIDYVISTLDIQIDWCPMILVSPLVRHEDKAILSCYFRKKMQRELEEELFLSVVEDYASHRDIAAFKEVLRKEFSILLRKSKQKEEKKLMLKDVLKQSMISLEFQADTWEQAVREAGRLLLEEECVDGEYIESMVNTVKTMGTYIVIAEGIALPHSRSGDHAHKVGISFVRLARPVEFGHPENDPVDLIFGLSSTDNKAHLNALKDLSSILTSEEQIAFLRKASNEEEIYQFICRQEGGERT